MRFAGQRFRQGKMRNPKFSADSGRFPDARYTPSIQGLEPSRARMPEQSAANYAKTVEPSFNIGEFREPEFRA